MPLHGKWRSATYLRQQQAPLVLVGHSLGGSVILRYLADHGIPAGLAGVVLIATPFWGMSDWEAEWALPSGFEARLAMLPRIVLYHSRDDDIAPVAHVDRYAEALPKALVRKVDGRGHLFADGNAGRYCRRHYRGIRRLSVHVRNLFGGRNVHT